ncbi:MAG: hypothetical protein ACTHJ3_16230 [Pararhizobium sp.]
MTEPRRQNRLPRPRLPVGDRVAWLAGIMIAIGAIMCFAALLNL